VYHAGLWYSPPFHIIPYSIWLRTCTCCTTSAH